MKTTLDLPDKLMREVKIRAAEENRKLKDMISDLLVKGLAQPSSPDSAIRDRVVFPRVRAAHSAAPGKELTPDRMKEILLEQDVDRALGR